MQHNPAVKSPLAKGTLCPDLTPQSMPALSTSKAVDPARAFNLKLRFRINYKEEFQQSLDKTKMNLSFGS